MATLVGYSDILVIQRKKHSGCIPAGIEWLLRYLKIPNVNLEAFQEQHDLGVFLLGFSCWGERLRNYLKE